MSIIDGYKNLKTQLIMELKTSMSSYTEVPDDLHQTDVPTLPATFKASLGNERFVDLLNDLLKEYTLLYEENKARS